MKNRFHALPALFIAVVLLCTACSGRANNTQNTEQPRDSLIVDSQNEIRPKMQIVFLLDATGSMAGLMNTAKSKIWSITSSFTQANPAPEIEVGIIFYRDRGDNFITQIVPLGKDMDNMYEKLMAMEATGGGDTPESVNQALYEGVTKIQWDSDPKTYRSIFLVGDCPPHMDYKNDVKYPEGCAEAKKKNIIVNTILMGGDRDALPIWKEIAELTGGEFIQTDMSVNDISVTTPYDDRINSLQSQLDETRVYYGKDKEKTEVKKMQSMKMKDVDAATNARRAEYNMSKSGKASYYGAGELINDAIGGKNVSNISTEELPENMQKMSETERKEYVDAQIVKRKKLEEDIAKLSKQRQEYIDKETEKMDADKVSKSFDDVIYESVKSQAEEKSIKLEGKAKR